MILLKKLYLSLTTASIVIACQHDKQRNRLLPSTLNLIVSNESQTRPNVLMTIELDDSLIINKNFSYQETAINPYTLSFPVKNGLHTITAKTNSNGLVRKKIVTLGNLATNLFIAYIYHSATVKEIQAERKIMQTSKVDTSTLETAPNIIFHTIKGKVVLQ